LKQNARTNNWLNSLGFSAICFLSTIFARPSGPNKNFDCPGSGTGVAVNSMFRPAGVWIDRVVHRPDKIAADQQSMMLSRTTQPHYADSPHHLR